MTIEYPDRISYFGGIKHLPIAEKNKILESDTVPPHVCCTNPYWLFRIFQDTIATESEIIELINGALVERSAKLKQMSNVVIDIGNKFCLQNG
jgi:protein O-mannose beta-1,4-N-acetylglucosaminyltransferase